MAKLTQIYSQATQPTDAQKGDFWVRLNGRTDMCVGTGPDSLPRYSPMGAARELELPVAAVQATCTIVENGTEVTNLDTVTILGVTYRFKTAPLANNLDVLRSGSSAATDLENLVKAIMDSGTPDTTYKITNSDGNGAAARTDITATFDTATATLTAIDIANGSQRGALGNNLTKPDVTTAHNLTASVWSGGVNGTSGEVGSMTTDGTNLYVCVGANGLWKQITLDALGA